MASLFYFGEGYAKIGLCRLSSVVEHFHGKEGVSGSNPEDGSIGSSTDRGREW